jgi:hypothetical protein
MVIDSFVKRTKPRCHFRGGSDARVIISLDEAAGIRRLRTGDHSRTHARKSSTAKALLLRPIRGKHSRARQKQWQTAAKLTTLTGIRSFMKAHAILWQKLYARFSGCTFHRGNRVLVSRVATDLDIRDRVSMKTGRLGQVPNRSTAAPSEFVRLSQPAAPMTHVTKPKPTSPCPRINGGIQ